MKIRIVEVEGEGAAAMAAAILGLALPAAAAPVVTPVEGPKELPARQVSAPKPVARRAPAAKEGRKPAEPADAAAGVESSDSSTIQQISKLLAGGGRTTSDIIKTLKLSAPAVYSALTAMRKAGRIRMGEDKDGYRANFLNS